MGTILEGLEGVSGLIDDTLVHGKDESEHDARLTKVLERIQFVGGTLNQGKCEFKKSEVKFLGQKVSREGVQADPEKTRAIRNIETPRTVSDLRRL